MLDESRKLIRNDAKNLQRDTETVVLGAIGQSNEVCFVT